MPMLQNTAVEIPEKIFEVTVIIFGTTTRNAVTRTIQVLAQTARGAKRICKMRYRRSEIKAAREIAPARAYSCPALF